MVRTGPDRVWHLSQDYRMRPPANRELFAAPSYRLLQMAARMVHGKSKAELSHRRHHMREPEAHAKYWFRKYTAPKKNDPLPQIYVAQEYLLGQNVATD